MRGTLEVYIAYMRDVATNNVSRHNEDEWDVIEAADHFESDTISQNSVSVYVY